MYVEISESIALGETSSTAYRGDRGKIAYDHSQSAHAPSNAEANQNAFSNVKIDSDIINASTTTDTLEFIAGNNIILTPNVSNKKITVSQVPVRKTASGDIASLSDGTGDPFLEVKVNIVPVQSGSGTPSPSNIRPISGWTEANITVAGKNLYDETQTLIKGRYTSDGSIAGTSSELNKHTGLIKIQGGKTYTYYNAIPYTVQIYGVWFDADKQYISTFALPKSPTTASTATAPNNACYVALSIYNETNQKVQFEVGVTATEYEAYNDTTYNIEFEDSGSPLTVYGGTLDVKNGVLTVTDGYIASYNGETLPSTWISDRDVYSAGTTPTTGAEVVYKLATPTEVSLTPTEITTLYGNNNIWADSGDMVITYVRDTSIAINDALNQSITPTYSSGTKIADYNIGGQTGAIYVQGGGGHMDTLWTGSETPTMSYNPTIQLAHPISDYDFLLVNFNNYNGNFYLKSTVTLYGLTAGDYVAQEILPAAGVAMFAHVINDSNITLNCYGGSYENTTYVSIIGVKL